MGSTAVGVLFLEHAEALVVNVGDSRAYEVM